jgi:hypothetical protein
LSSLEDFFPSWLLLLSIPEHGADEGLFLAIDLKKHHVKGTHRTAAKSDNVYLKLLVKLYRFLVRKYRANINSPSPLPSLI